MKKHAKYIVWLTCVICFYLNPGGIHAAEISANTMATGNQVKDFTGTDQVKLVFHNNGFLYLVDFTGSGDKKPSIEKLPQTAGGVVPNISPDGKWLVYGVGPSGDMTNSEKVKSSAFVTALDISAKSQLVTADNAHEPRFQTDSDHDQIIYSTVGKWGAWNGIGEVRSKSWDGTSSGKEKTVTDKGSFYGGFNGRYLASGSNNGILLDVSKRENKPDTVIKYALYKKSTDKWDYKSRQFCNPSISPSKKYPGVLMGLDFGSASKVNDSINNGKRWGLHDLILLANHEGKLIKTILRPDVKDLPGIDPGDGSLNPGQHWDDPEWSNNPCFAVANLQVSRSFDPTKTENWENTDFHERIFLINLKKSTYLELVRSSDLTLKSPTDMQWPHINIQGEIKEDDGWMDISPIRSPLIRNLGRGTHFYQKGSILYFGSNVEKIQLLDLNGRTVFEKNLWGKNQVNLKNIPMANKVKILTIKGSSGFLYQQLVLTFLK
ncbi:MAG: hypothetical protein PVI26_14025 [Chitinispirillia bacterium]|jgi:hypothetical protein